MTGTLYQDLALSRIRDRRGRIRARLSYRVPSNVTGLTVMVPPGTEVESADGFRRQGGSQFRWRGGSDRPRMELSVSAGSGGGLGGSMRADVGDWAIVEAPHVMSQWRHRGSQPAFERRVAVDDRGVASSDGGLVYLGPHEEHVRRAAGQRIRLIEPEAASLAEPPGELLDALAFAAREFAVGGRNDEVVGVAAPTRPVNWGAGGLQAGANGFWVRDAATLDTPNTSWIHEYVHTRQEFGTSTGTKWLIEATAVYYATLLGYRRGDIDDGTYHAALNTDRCSGDVLGNPLAWSSAHAPYQKGSRVAAWLDGQIRAESDAALADVLSAMNRVSEQSTTGTPLTTALSGGDAITYDALEKLVAEVMGVSRRGGTFRRIADGLDAVVMGRDVPEEHPPPGLAERPPDVPDAPGMPSDLAEMLEEAFGERFGEEVVESDGRIDEGTAFGGDDGPEVGELGEDPPGVDEVGGGDDGGPGGLVEGGTGPGGTDDGSGFGETGGIIEPGEIFGGDGGPGGSGGETVTVRVESAGGEVEVGGDVDSVEVDSDGQGISVEAAGADVTVDGTSISVEGGGTEISVSGDGISVRSSGGTDVSVSTTGGITAGGDVEVGPGGGSGGSGDACSFCGADLSGHGGSNCPSCGWPVGW